MIGTNCLGRLSPVIARVMDCKRVPSPPASMIAHRSLMSNASLCWSSPNNHESRDEGCSLQLLPAVLLNEFCDQAGPTRLMAGANTGTVVAVKVFVERNKVAPVSVAMKLFDGAKNRPPLILVF